MMKPEQIKQPQQYAHDAVTDHSADPVTNHAADSKKAQKHRKMNWKEKASLIVAGVAAAALCTVMILNMKLIAVERMDESGNIYTEHISLLQKFRDWRPFIGLNGELNSKEYSFQVDSQYIVDSGNEDSKFDDGLDLDQIQEGQFSVLFLGLDELRSNTDVMMLVMFDIANNNIHILQIPRDSFVPDATSFEGGKINSIYMMGDQTKTPVQRVVDAVEETFQIPIDRYVTTGCTDIVQIVDLIGGIPIDMPYTIRYEAGKTIYAGEQTLSGQQAEWMVRYRHGYNEGDIGRMKAQRIFLAAAMEKVCDIGTLKLMQYADTIIDEKLMGSNLSMDEISKLSDFATTVGMDHITMHMLPGEGTMYYPNNWHEYEKYSVWSIHKSAAISLLNKYFRPYFESVYDLPIQEVVPEGQYLSTIYDDDQAAFDDINNGETFNGE